MPAEKIRIQKNKYKLDKGLILIYTINVLNLIVFCFSDNRF